MNQQTYIQSVNLNQETNFPYLVLDVINDQSYPRNPGFQVMHWHEDLQFIYVLSGEIQVVTLDDQQTLQAGDGIFINKNVVHLVKQTNRCHYNSFIFPDHFLTFYAGSPAERFVEQITSCAALPLYPIFCTEGNQAVLHVLQKLSRLEREEKFAAYPYTVLTTVCELWLALCQIIQTPHTPTRHSIAEQRMHVFLQYIARHFGEKLSLSALAESANVSKSECLRCFKTVLHTTPYQYLNEYRLSQAAERLRTTNDSISTIAAEVGFPHLSHFGKCFREKTGLTPSMYRKQR